MEHLNDQAINSELNQTTNEVVTHGKTPVYDLPLHVVMMEAFIVGAASRERDRFWAPKSSTVIKSRDNLVKTLCALAAQKRNDSQLETEDGYYRVSDYKLPSKIHWLPQLINFGHRIYVTETQKSNLAYEKVEVRPNDFRNLPGRILTPQEMAAVVSNLKAENGNWNLDTEVNKQELPLSELYGVFGKHGQQSELFVFNSSKSDLFVQMLGLRANRLSVFGAEGPYIQSLEGLVGKMVSTAPVDSVKPVHVEK